VQFSTRPSPVHLYFSIDNIEIKPVDAHNHLGVTHSADGKWSKDIQKKFVKNICKIFIRSLLECYCEVRDSCTVVDADRLEKVQLKAARIPFFICRNWLGKMLYQKQYQKDVNFL
jgi:heptaprenylglyceryl phosphate synthase